MSLQYPSQPPATTESVTLNRTPATANAVKEAQYAERIRYIERRSKLSALDDYIGFVVSKVLGLFGLVVGGLAFVAPELCPVVLTNPAWIAGAGLALLTGKKVLTLIAKVERISK